MGLFSGIASFCTNAVNAVKSFFGGGGGEAVSKAITSYGGGSSHTSTSHSTTTTTYTYDPDRVKAAQLDKERAQLENERIELMKQAQLDIIEAQTRSKIAQEQARAEGFVRIAEAITDLQEKLNVIAQRRIAIIESGTLQAVREAEDFYAELMKTIQEDNDRYTAEKLPRLLEILGRYEEGSPAHTLYVRKIDEDITLQAHHTTRQLDSVITRQERLINDILAAKAGITAQTNEITSGMLEALRGKLAELDSGLPQLPSSTQNLPSLPA